MEDGISEKVAIVLLSTDEGTALRPVDITREVGGTVDEVALILEKMTITGDVWKGPSGRYSMSRKGREARGFFNAPKTEKEDNPIIPRKAIENPPDEPTKKTPSNKKTPSKCSFCPRVLASQAFRMRHEKACPLNPKNIPAPQDSPAGNGGEAIENEPLPDRKEGLKVKALRVEDSMILEAIEEGLAVLRMPNMSSVTLELRGKLITISNQPGDKNNKPEKH